MCKAPGHDRRNCPHREAPLVTEVDDIPVDQENGVIARVIPPSVMEQTPQVAPRMNWDECLYVLFDLETMGLSSAHDDIIELAAMVVGPDSVMVEDGTFQALVKPRKNISNFITMLTGISNEMVAEAPLFSTVVEDFFDFVQSNVDGLEMMAGKKISHVVFVAHNGNSFDFPFLL